MKNNYYSYFISETGKIYLDGDPHPTKKDPQGNVVAYLRIEGKGKTVRIAQLVCRLYKDMPKNHHAVIFKDGNKSNITLDNMVTMTTSNAGKHRQKQCTRPVITRNARKPMPEPEKNIMSISWK